MSMEELTGKIEKTVIKTWVDKKKNVGKEVDYVITRVQKLDTDLVLTLKYGNDNEEMLRISAKMVNEIIDHLGDDISDWLNESVTIRFDIFTPKKGAKNMSEGVTSVFIWPEEEIIELEK